MSGFEVTEHVRASELSYQGDTRVEERGGNYLGIILELCWEDKMNW